MAKKQSQQKKPRQEKASTSRRPSKPSRRGGDGSHSHSAPTRKGPPQKVLEFPPGPKAVGVVMTGPTTTVVVAVGKTEATAGTHYKKERSDGSKSHINVVGLKRKLTNGSHARRSSTDPGEPLWLEAPHVDQLNAAHENALTNSVVFVILEFEGHSTAEKSCADAEIVVGREGKEDARESSVVGINDASIFYAGSSRSSKAKR